MRRKSNGATDHHLTASQSTSGEGCNSELRLDQIPQDLPTVMDVNVSMETAADENELSSLANYVNNDSENSEYHDHDDCSYCPYKSKSITHSPNSKTVENYINNHLDVAPCSPKAGGDSPSSPIFTSQEGTMMQMQISPHGPSPAKLQLLDLSLDGSDDGIYEDSINGVNQSQMDDEMSSDNGQRMDTNEVRNDEIDHVASASVGQLKYAMGVNVLPRVSKANTVDGRITKDPLSETNDKNKERTESIDSRTSTDDDEETIDGWKNVGIAQDIDTDGSMRSSSIDGLGDGKCSSVDLTGGGSKHSSDGFLDEYPVIMDEADCKNARFDKSHGESSTSHLATPAAERHSIGEEIISPPTTVSASDCMDRFSSLTGPSPVKLKSPHTRDYFNVDLSMDVSREITEEQCTTEEAQSSTPEIERQSVTDATTSEATVSALDCMNRFSSVTGPSPVKLKGPHSRDYFNFDMSMETSMEGNESRDENASESDDNMNVWNGNGIDIAIDEAGEDSTLNESCTDTDASAAVEKSSISLKDEESLPRSEFTSPLIVEETAQQGLTQQSDFVQKRSLRKSRKRKTIPTSTSMLHLEYNVDHSCSTPLERLARDVGNVLRQWNVHNGCDRHIPLDWADKGYDNDNEEAPEQENESCNSGLNNENVSPDTDEINRAIEGEMTVENNQIMSMDLCMDRFANRSRKLNEWMGEDATKIPSKIDMESNETKSSKQTEDPSPRKSKGQANSKLRSSTGAQCIRSKKIMFETTGFTPGKNLDESTDQKVWTRRRYSIPLLLSLWDAPSIQTDIYSDAPELDEMLSGIPLSLRPKSYSSHAVLGDLGVMASCGTTRKFYDQSSTHGLNTGFGRDISSLFNIGQHITLSLDLDAAQYSSKYNQEHKHLHDIQALYDDVYAYFTDTMEQALEQKALTAQERQRRLRKQRKRAPKKLELDSNNQSNDCHKHYGNGEIVAVGSQSMSLDIGEDDGDEQVLLFNRSDKESNNTDHSCRMEQPDDVSFSSDDDETLMMSLDNELRLKHTEIHAEVISVLTSIFQNAMNLAACQNTCHIPVFGMWGSYRGSSSDKRHDDAALKDNECAVSSWIPSGSIPSAQHSPNSAWEEDEAQLNKLLLSSPSLMGQCQRGLFRSTHRVYSITNQTLPLHLSTLHGLSCVLLAQCPPHADTNRVMVNSARHCYYMDTVEHKSDQTWRNDDADGSSDEPSSIVEDYIERCHQTTNLLLERASSPLLYKSVPAWGPSGNPLKSLSASVSWGFISTDVSIEGLFSPSSMASPTAALLQLPLKIRSSNFRPTASELQDMECSLQSAAFDPIGMGIEVKKDGVVQFGPREPIFLASASFDSDLPCATLSANLRCVLAALLRCGSLGPDTLPGHLTRKRVLSKLGGPAESSNDRATKDAIDTITELDSMLKEGLKHVGPATIRLVEAMDWKEVGSISSANVNRGINDGELECSLRECHLQELTKRTRNHHSSATKRCRRTVSSSARRDIFNR